ncbi:MAG: ankyrin repeat domain-containing protein [Bryobacteraceae bacterium]|nr:ankyrin repeat domain-containing protein [Bryobacteraceae bacterium]
MMHRLLSVALLLGASTILFGQIPDFTPPTPLFAAVMRGDTAAVKQLMESGANPDEGRFFGASPLTFALGQSHHDMTRVLVNAGADIAVADATGSTPLMWAAYNEEGDPGMVELLISKGAAIDAANKNGETALTWAMRRGHTPVVKALRSHGASDRNMTMDAVQRAVNALQKADRNS